MTLLTLNGYLAPVIQELSFQDLATLAQQAKDRVDLICSIVERIAPERMLEIGVYKGDLSAPLLDRNTSISEYLMIDPWRNLDDWNKPANRQNDEFEKIFQSTMERTAFAKDRIKVLRGTTTEVISQVEDKSLDVVYVDADHTLRGITIDLLSVYPKMKDSGWILGDDLLPTLWQHNMDYEPTMVFPLAIHFAEGIQRRMIILPYNQFAIDLSSKEFELINHSGHVYKETEILPHFRRAIDEAVEKAGLKSRLIRSNPGLYKVYQAIVSPFRTK